MRIIHKLHSILFIDQMILFKKLCFSNTNAKLRRSNAFITIKKKPTLRRSNAKVWGNCITCDKPKCEFNGFVFACDDLYCYQNLFEEEREEDWDY